MYYSSFPRQEGFSIKNPAQDLPLALLPYFSLWVGTKFLGLSFLCDLKRVGGEEWETSSRYWDKKGTWFHTYLVPVRDAFYLQAFFLTLQKYCIENDERACGCCLLWLSEIGESHLLIRLLCAGYLKYFISSNRTSEEAEAQRSVNIYQA